MKHSLPQGFILNGLNCGIKADSKKNDIGLIYCEQEFTVAGVTTKSTTAAACVHYNKKVFTSGKGKALVVNSGNANAFTGKQGEQVVYDTALACSRELDITPQEVLIASTGIIGQQLSLPKLEKGIAQLAKLTKKTTSNIFDFSDAIKTTDLTDKIITKHLTINGNQATITGIAKGSGMIHPNMATMLAFVVTDLDIDKAELDNLVTKFTDISFNMITVDGDTSTNDMAILMSNGLSGIAYKDSRDEINNALEEVFIFLAKEIVRDGEGATKLIETKVTGAKSKEDAIKAAKQIVGSPLVKTAIYGESSNLGRVVAAIGATEVKINRDKLNVDWQGIKTADVFISVDLGVGNSEAIAWGCDLSEKYIEINTNYN